MGKAGTYNWKKVLFFLSKYLHPTECRYLSYAGLFVTYFGIPTKWKKNYSYFAHYHSIIRLNTVVHMCLLTSPKSPSARPSLFRVDVI